MHPLYAFKEGPFLENFRLAQLHYNSTLIEQNPTLVERSIGVNQLRPELLQQAIVSVFNKVCFIQWSHT